MHIYLPIAEMSVHIFGILLLGGAAGLLSGMFGIGGGFLMTPLLIFMGVPPTVAVATSSNQIIASSVSGFLAHWRRQNVDVKMGTYILMGGIVGSSFGVWVFQWLRTIGQIDLVISLSYVAFLTFVGIVMGRESVRTIRHAKRKSAKPEEPEGKTIWQRLPLQVDFPRSDIHVSALLPITVGAMSGVITSLLGIGGGFLMVPAMLYLLRMPASVVVGTSLFQIIFTSANTTFLHAVTTQTVDVVLAILLLTGSVFSAQLGSRIATKLPGAHLRAMLAGIVLLVAARLAYGLLITPDNLYSFVVG